MREKIDFEYDKDVPEDEQRENQLLTQVNIWFKPFEEEIKLQFGRIKFFLKANNENRVHLDNMEEDLKDRLHERLKLFQPRLPI